MKNVKKFVILTVITCLFLSGCGVGISMSNEDVNIESSVGLFNQHASYFDRYSCEKDETTCKIKGTLHQAADDRNGFITYVTTQDSNGSMTVTGSMNCTAGSLQLVYMAPDGTEILISDGAGKKIDAQIDVTEGEGTICFVSDGKSSVCEFNLKLEAGDGVTFASGMEELESIEGISSEEIKEPDAVEDIGLEEIEDNWPESIRYSSDGVYANPMSVSFEVDEPMTLSVSCATRDGELRVKIVDDDSFKETVYFDETDPDGTYTVDLDKKGTYQLLIYAKYHVGRVEITPVKE